MSDRRPSDNIIVSADKFGKDSQNGEYETIPLTPKPTRPIAGQLFQTSSDNVNHRKKKSCFCCLRK